MIFLRKIFSQNLQLFFRKLFVQLSPDCGLTHLVVCYENNWNTKATSNICCVGQRLGPVFFSGSVNATTEIVKLIECLHDLFVTTGKFGCAGKWGHRSGSLWCCCIPPAATVAFADDLAALVALAQHLGDMLQLIGHLVVSASLVPDLDCHGFD